MHQFQIQKSILLNNRLVEIPKQHLKIGDGEILVKIDKFALTANNITYAVAGDMLGYWQFFPPVGEDITDWGVFPVWGFADVVQSNVEEIPIGERFYGYFPPASHLKMSPTRISNQKIIDGSAHRAALPQGYNVYQRVLHEPGYSSSMDNMRALTQPLFMTSYCIWHALKNQDWYGAQQVLLLSASSKTSIGVGYAMQTDDSTPKVIGITSERNLEMVKNLNLYDQSIRYEDIKQIDADTPTVIIDMSGNQPVLVGLHQHLGENMKFTLNVGITHWKDAQPQKGIITERCGRFFAPSEAAQMIKEWGFGLFNQRVNDFFISTVTKTNQWLTLKTLKGLEGMVEIYPNLCQGKIPANEGLIVQM